MISIIIPTFNNIEYLKICLNSLKKNSNFNHEVILHINDGSDGTLNYAVKNKILYSYTQNNVGLCTAINTAVSKSTTDLILYAHDDMYFCPNWDNVLLNEVNLLNHNNFYFSGTMIERNSGHISFDCGESYKDFDETKLLNNFKSLKYYDHQGSHFAPHLVHKKIWDAVGGFSEEFNPGMCSDPDFNMKLWKAGIRIFKGIDKFRVYHFGSVTTRKKTNFKKNKGDVTFLKKWGFSHKFFKKHFLKSKTKYSGLLLEPNRSFFFYFDLLICKIKIFYYNL